MAGRQAANVANLACCICVQGKRTLAVDRPVIPLELPIRVQSERLSVKPIVFGAFSVFALVSNAINDFPKEIYKLLYTKSEEIPW